jgi:uncharacterized protein YbjT (DUF2867 family)
MESSLPPQPKQITVFGATGHVGQLVVKDLIRRGYRVTAFVHSRTLTPPPGVHIVTGDISDPGTVRKALEGSQALISCLSSWHGKPDKNILTTAMQTTLQVADSPLRIISLTGSVAFVSSDHPNLIDRVFRWGISLIGGAVIRDGETHIQLLSESNQPWTVLRSPVMNNRGTSTYTLSNQIAPPWGTIKREAVAHCLVDLIEDSSAHHKTLTIHR